ncbi:MAG: hypothetical protein ABSF83_03860 [Nitrososphaerales archaeon]|jgi:hypothetical protein
MKPIFMFTGAYLFVLGAAMIAISSLTASYGLYSLAASELDAVNLGLKLALIGVVIAPIGAALFAYGIGASSPTWTDDETESAAPPMGETGADHTPAQP